MKQKLGNLANLGSWPSFKGVILIKKSSKNKENVSFPPPPLQKKKVLNWFTGHRISSRLHKLSQSSNHDPGSPLRPNSPQFTPSSPFLDIDSTQNAPSEPEQMDYTSSIPTVEPDKMPKSQKSASPEIGSNNDVPNMDMLRQPPPWINQSKLMMGMFQPPPSIDKAHMACKDLNNILRPQWSLGIRYKDPSLDPMFQGWLKDMVMFLWHI